MSTHEHWAEKLIKENMLTVTMKAYRPKPFTCFAEPRQGYGGTDCMWLLTGIPAMQGYMSREEFDELFEEIPDAKEQSCPTPPPSPKDSAR